MTGEAWLPVIEYVQSEWPGRWLAPDLPGHGRSCWGMPYGIGRFAAAVAELLCQAQPVYVLGHSMGAAVAVALASGWFGVDVKRAFALGIKLEWSREDLERSARRAVRPIRWFDDEIDAKKHYVKVSGLEGIVGSRSPMVSAGVVKEHEKWRLAADPRAHFVAAQPPNLLSVLDSRVSFAAGELDTFISPHELRQLQPDAAIFVGAHHNSHIEQPLAVWGWIFNQLQDVLG
ncbi:alpha/beta hydrolase [Bradyrhizobium commune]|uniref:Alpha/beta hydrolase n=1 Tax=Bradyrhizobium commune TaxID=83627 RepID=A0A7S9D5F7_9BRAD|nr:alpha/beta hydrolase [Bradyrhizobium commune]QPF90724.1 alpha/beta hydrolase [Bradyrhizobium commune]